MEGMMIAGVQITPVMLWIALIIIFLVVEIATVGLTSIWFAGGALAALVVAAVGGAWWLQVVVFFVVAIILIVFTRPVAMKYLKPKTVKTNYEEAIGQKVRITEKVDNIQGTGTVIYKGLEWSAKSAAEDVIFEAEEIAEVVEVQGVKLVLKKIEE